MLGLLLLPFKIVAAIIRLVIRVILLPLRLIVGGCLLHIVILLIFIAIMAVLAYFIYHWLT